MSLKSALFRGDPKLEAAAISDPAHIMTGAAGQHVVKIQQALITRDGAVIHSGELQAARGASTARAALAYKRKRKIINWSYQSQADAIVGKMTIVAMDRELLKLGPVPPPAPTPPSPVPATLLR
jgi:hypothetical protein